MTRDNLDLSSFYPLYIKEMRKEYEIPQKELANFIGISNSSLSKIESGVRELSPENFRKVLRYIKNIDSDFHFNPDIAQIKNSQEILYEALNLFVRMESDAAKSTLTSYLDDIQNNYSFGHYYYLLAKIFLLMLENKEYIDPLNDLIDLNFFQDEFDLAIIYDLLGISTITSDQDMLVKQIQALKRGRSFAVSIHSKVMIGLADFHLISKYIRYDIRSAFLYIAECKEALEDIGAYKRLDWLKLNEATMYHRLRIYGFTIEILSDLWRTTSKKDTYFRRRIAENLSFTLLIQRKYSQSIQMAEIAYNAGGDYPDIFISLVYANFRLEQMDAVNKYLELWDAIAPKSPRATCISLFLDLVSSIANGKELSQSDIRRAENYINKNPEIELDGIFYETMSEYFEARNDCRHALEYQKKFTRYLENNVFLEHADTAKFSVEAGKVNIDDKPNGKKSDHPGS